MLVLTIITISIFKLKTVLFTKLLTLWKFCWHFGSQAGNWMNLWIVLLSACLALQQRTGHQALSSLFSSFQSSAYQLVGKSFYTLKKITTKVKYFIFLRQPNLTLYFLCRCNAIPMIFFSSYFFRGRWVSTDGLFRQRDCFISIHPHAFTTGICHKKTDSKTLLTSEHLILSTWRLNALLKGTKLRETWALLISFTRCYICSQLLS